ncbi:MAG: hypothetical protein GF334_09360 [Candidatus Altiarchaeales archaeon]|nr:hypothetical protein [Candidatus Altiarchaeales archaeon]
MNNTKTGSVELSGTSVAILSDVNAVWGGAVTADTSYLDATNCVFGGSSSFGADSRVELRETMITGSCTAASGSGIFKMDGGYIRGTLTDTGNRLLFNSSNPLNKKIALVNPSHNMANDNTSSLGNPFKTIQAAVDAVALLNPTQYDRSIVEIVPGRYDETVIIDSKYITLKGKGSGIGEDVLIQNTTNIDFPAVVITNATRASVNTWLAAGSANWVSNYGLLVDSGNQAGSVTLESLSTIGGNSFVAGLVVAGVGGDQPSCKVCYSRVFDTDSVYGFWGNSADLFLSESFCGRFEAYDSPSLYGWRSTIGAVNLNGSSSLIFHNCYVGSFTMNDSSVFGTGTPFQEASQGIHVLGNISLNDSSDFFCDSLFVAGNLYCNDSGDWTARSAHINGNVTLDDGTVNHDGGHIGGEVTLNNSSARWNGKDVHVQGDFDIASGAVAELLGGRYMGSIIGTGTFNRTLGN